MVYCQLFDPILTQWYGLVPATGPYVDSNYDAANLQRVDANLHDIATLNNFQVWLLKVYQRIRQSNSPQALQSGRSTG